jgi:hypothetical protein
MSRFARGALLCLAISQANPGTDNITYMLPYNFGH